MRTLRSLEIGAGVPVPHYHKAYDEIIYGVEGVVTFTVEGKPVDIGPGETCFIPRGAVHGFNVNAGGPPDVEKLNAVMLKHGLVPAMPRVACR
jgi:quercetin dioxygenase-like cupin family protein